VQGTVLIKRVCGHSSPYTFKPNERYAKQRLEKFLAKKCPACTIAAIKTLEAKQQVDSQQHKAAKRRKRRAVDGDGASQPASC
jgi:phage FluMu protein Com